MSARFLRIALVLVLGGCAATPLPPLPPTHPGNPGAPEANAPEPSSTLRDAADSEDRAAAASYTCPMHPEVHSRSPGQCPKCGMTLVPETGTQPMGDGRHAH